MSKPKNRGGEMGALSNIAALYGLDGVNITVPGLEPETNEPKSGPDESAQDFPRFASLSSEESRWLAGRLAILERNQPFCQALEAILSERRDWFKGQNLWAFLAIISVFADSGGRGVPRRIRERIWSLDTGKTWKTLRGFPGRLKNMAKEVEMVSRGLGFNPQTFIGDDTLKKRYVKRQFRLLPGTMLIFAAYIEQAIERLPIETATHLPPAKRGYSQYVRYLSEFVKAFTGKPRDSQVAAVLNATWDALRPGTRGSDEGFDAQTIVDLRQACKRRSRTLK